MDKKIPILGLCLSLIGLASHCANLVLMRKYKQNFGSPEGEIHWI